MPRLFHFSEDPEIAVFHPRPPLRHPDAAPLVWAIDEWHSPIYHLPRDCPRVTFWTLPGLTLADIDRWMIDPSIRMVICVEASWLTRIQAAVLYRYEFVDSTFIDCKDHGVHTSEVAAQPIAVEPLTDLLKCLTESEIELRICQSLAPIGQAIQSSTLHFSLIRMSKATGWDGPAGTPVMP